MPDEMPDDQPTPPGNRDQQPPLNLARGIDADHVVPDDVGDGTVEALGKLSEAYETLQRARGHLYAFHQLVGRADRQVGEAAGMLWRAGHGRLAEGIEREVVGRNVLAGRWTFQIVEEFEDGYHAAFAAWERRSREELVGGRRHLHEARMKQDRRTPGEPGHEATPRETSG